MPLFANVSSLGLRFRVTLPVVARRFANSLLLGCAERPRTSASPRLPFSKFWYCLELTWLYEPYFLSVRRYVFDSDSHRSELIPLLLPRHFA